jgi:uncharacterized protein (DUF302 family)
MSYYFNAVLSTKNFEEAIELVTAELKKEGFGILTEIDVQDTLKKKIDVDFRRYKILGACNPHFAHRALTAESKMGVYLPCSVIVEETDKGTIEVAVVDPISAMSAVDNQELASLALEVQEKLKKVISNLK